MNTTEFEIVVCGIVQNDAGEFLLAQREHDNSLYPSHRSMPGGKIEADSAERTPDIFEKTVVRELHEEIGISVDNINYLCSLHLRSYGVHRIYVICTARHLSGKARPLAETATVRFVSLQEAKELTLVPHVLEVLKRAIAN